MFRKYLLPLLAVAGVLFAIRTVVTGGRAPPPSPPVAEPARAPYAAYVAAAGLVEARSENIAIGTPVGEVVASVARNVGDRVEAGDELFRLRSEVVEAELAAREAALRAAEAKLKRLREMPRAEDVPPAEARLREADAALAEARVLLADARSALARWEKVDEPAAVSQDEVDRRRYAVRSGEARVATAEARRAAIAAELELLRAGAWEADVSIAEAEGASARAAVLQAKAEVERRIVRAPVAGTILQVKVRPGEYAQPGPLATPLMLLGETEYLHVRCDVDENDAWRVRTDAPARARGFVRGNTALATDLEFVRIEPYVVPKRSLTGESTERVDTRVLQVIYAFRREALPVYVGQQMDVFIEAPPVAASPATNAGTRGFSSTSE